MGTSGSYGGPGGKNPLIPSWLDTGGNGESDPTQPSPQQPSQPDETPRDNQNPQDRVNGSPDASRPLATPTVSFQIPRSNMTRYVSTGGTKGGSLRKAVSSYIQKGSGGVTNASKRMGSSRNVARGLLSFVSEVQRSGVDQALKMFNLSALANKPIEDVLISLGDELLPTSGSVDAGIARDAWEEVVVDVINSGAVSIEIMNSDQLLVIFESFVSNSIFNKLQSDIGKSTIQLPKDAKEVNNIQVQIRDFIGGAVKDAVRRTIPDMSQLTLGVVENVTSDVYKQSFEILVALGGF